MTDPNLNYIPKPKDILQIMRHQQEIGRGIVTDLGDDDHGNPYSRLTFFVDIRIITSDHKRLSVGETIRFESKEGALFGYWSGIGKAKLGPVKFLQAHDQGVSDD